MTVEEPAGRHALLSLMVNVADADRPPAAAPIEAEPGVEPARTPVVAMPEPFVVLDDGAIVTGAPVLDHVTVWPFTGTPCRVRTVADAVDDSPAKTVVGSNATDSEPTIDVSIRNLMGSVWPSLSTMMSAVASFFA